MASGREYDWHDIAPLEAKAETHVVDASVVRLAWELLRASSEASASSDAASTGGGASGKGKSNKAASVPITDVADLMLGESSVAALWAAHRALRGDEAAVYFSEQQRGLWAPRTETQARP